MTRTPVRIFLHGTGVAFAAAIPIAVAAQASGVAPQSAVAIENTNANFFPAQGPLPQAFPARPTVTPPAHIPPTGYLQFEQGLAQAGASPGGTNGQFAVNQTTKLAVTTRLMALFVTQPYTENSVSGEPNVDARGSRPGDLSLGGQVIVHKSVGALPVIAMNYLHRVRAGDAANLDSGDDSQSLMLLCSGDPGYGFHYDSSLMFNEQNNGQVRRPQFAQTFDLSHPLFQRSTAGRLGGSLELSHFTQPFVTGSVTGRPVTRANALDLLFAVGYAVRPNLVLDADISHGLTSTSTQWQGGFGFTYLLPKRLWPDRHPVPIATRR